MCWHRVRKTGAEWGGDGSASRRSFGIRIRAVPTMDQEHRQKALSSSISAYKKKSYTV